MGLSLISGARLSGNKVHICDNCAVEVANLKWQMYLVLLVFFLKLFFVVKGPEKPSCKVLKGVDFPGEGTMNDGRNVITDSDEECCALCNAAPSRYFQRF